MKARKGHVGEKHPAPMHRLLCSALLLALVTCAAPAWAQRNDAPQAYSISAGDLANALDQLASQSKVQIIYPSDLVRGKTAPAVSGQQTWREALRKLLAGSGLEWGFVNDTTVVIRQSGKAAKPAASSHKQPEKAEQKPEPTSLQSVTVTGTRIRGGTTPSPVITIGAENIQEEGFTDLGEVIRNVPQNFSGGQNPGIDTGARSGGVGNQNITGGSGLNLRGLGQDASLTLLNGRRMSYGSFSQTVDISVIPVEAVDRIEIVADGASAIYGSDAVGGVGNVILKRDFDGVTIGARYGNATYGGLTTHEYTATAGTTWDTGGLIATWKKSSSDPIYSDQRDYTRDMYDPSTLYQGSDLRSGLLSAHQSLGDVVELHLDALRTNRKILTDTAYPTFYERYAHETTTSLVSPGIELSLPNDWTLSAGGAWSKDETDLDFTDVITATGDVLALVQGCYCNESRTYDVSAEGPLFALGGGDARLAVGTGYRHNDYQVLNGSGMATVDGGVSSRFAYAELSLPLIGPDQYISGMRRLALTGAMRGEDYDSFGRVTTPKFGMIYDPSTDFTLKASWGKSFKAPTLSEQYSTQHAYLYRAASLGGTGYATDATVLFIAGGNPDLNPERARTWSASLAFHPEALPGLEAELTRFDIDYTDRVVQPINPNQALSNPIYADFIDNFPTAAEQADALAKYALYNAAGTAYDPGKVVALARNLPINLSRQRVRGFDLSGSYRFDLVASQLTIRGSASWLDSSQQVTPDQDAYNLSGTLFYPTKINGRVGAVWNKRNFTASIFSNYKSSVVDTTSGKRGASFTTFDITLRYDTGKQDNVLSDLALGLSVQNFLNRAPPTYASTSLTNAPYDSTNYSPIGRYLSLSVSKHW
jgi:outer membrane receptor protein involved in Fe transport